MKILALVHKNSVGDCVKILHQTCVTFDNQRIIMLPFAADFLTQSEENHVQIIVYFEDDDNVTQLLKVRNYTHIMYEKSCNPCWKLQHATGLCWFQDEKFVIWKH
jgi:hypothetical protein